MKSKKLLISLTVVAIIVVVIVVIAAVLTVKKIDVVYHGFDGSAIAAPQEGIATDEILSAYKGKSIVFLSKSRLLSELNEKYTDWHAFAVVKHFPNEVEIHFVVSTAIAKFSAGGETYYIDSFGYSAPQPDYDVIDVSSAFSGQGLEVKSNELGKEFQFQSAVCNSRLKCVVQSVLATWQCQVDIDEMSQVLGDGGNVFLFNENGDLIISPKTGGKIVVQSPETDLSERLINAYGVYYNSTQDVQKDNVTITVYKNGRITSSAE